LLLELARRVEVASDHLSRLITQESGKPLTESRREVGSSVSYLRYHAAEGLKPRDRDLGRSPAHAAIQTRSCPAGVAVAITPWNYPLNTLCRKLAPALAAGCPVIAKPAPETPLSALVLAGLALEAGLPADVFRVVTTTRAQQAVSYWMADWRIRRVAFTGSTAVGRQLMRQAADRFPKLSLELGGNAPALVFDDADLDHAAREIVASRFRHSGQTCICIQRVFVERNALSELRRRLIAQIAKLRVGNGFAEVDCGPLIRESALRRCEEHVADARNHGAALLAGGRRLSLPDPDRGWFFEPTLLEGVPPQARLMREEVFGPVLAVAAFDTETEAITCANDCDYGLVAYAFTRDSARLSRLAVALQAGTIGLNTTNIVLPHVPFGGFKASGIGKENGSEGFEEFLDQKAVFRLEAGDESPQGTPRSAAP
jgi:succinate-semialdehyde dehydrogenase/glutarate-semialdehyde dehydrogenase